MTNTALITGASSGIGKELARYHASLGGNLIITARRKNELDALKDELQKAHGVEVEVIAVDLGGENGAEKLINAIKKLKMDVNVLINNAGFGGHGIHIERDLVQEQAMIDLNIKSLVALTHYFGGEMLQNGGGKILNVGSIVGFMPGPNQAIYFATKAFVNSFSQAVDHELRQKGVTCSVLVPGLVETEFLKSANLEGTKMLKAGGKTAKTVAKIGYDGMLKGKLVIFNEMKWSLLLGWVFPFMPRRMVLKAIGDAQSK